MCARKQQNTEEDIHDFANRTLIICCKYLLQIIRELIFVYSTDNLWLFNIVEPKIKFALRDFLSLFHLVEARKRDSCECEGRKIWLPGDGHNTHTLIYYRIQVHGRIHTHTHTHTHTQSNYGLQLSYQSSQVCMLKVPPITGSLLLRMLTCLPLCHTCKYIYSSSLSVSLFMSLLCACLLFIWCVWGGRQAHLHSLTI